ncbi:hypothetical protein HPB50_011703 [Hyalomma asiaticum]|uniref:Uncharacterized protein n=1 Tax=Hyalomma asiaticum TaxID=266040 RepID=A0ACB7SG80_HYAAI|nr:hypothetical protein HPB50_011703 [Hyalomma asiaticum]
MTQSQQDLQGLASDENVNENAGSSRTDHGKNAQPFSIIGLPKARSVLAMLLEGMDVGQVDLQDRHKGANGLMQDIDGRTALHLCAASSKPAALGCASLLLDAEPSLTGWQDYQGCTPLHLAVASGTMAVVDFLTQRSSDELNALDDLFRTPLHWAAILGRLEVSRLLLERGADASLTDRAGATPLYYACTSSSEQAGLLVALFLTHHREVEHLDLALQGAALAGNVAAVRALHCYEMHPEAAHAAVQAAAARGNLEVLQWLLDHFGSPKGPWQQLTPLGVAACGGHSSCVLALLDVGASAHGVDAGGRTALHW